MKHFSLLTLIVCLVLVATVPVLQPKRAEAQWVVEFGPAATALVSGILAATVSTASTTGVPGLGAATVATARESLGSACLATIVSLDATDAISTVLDVSAGATLDVIGGSPLEMTRLSTKLTAATAAKTCVDTYVEVLSRIPGVTLELSNEVAREQDKYTKVSNSLRLQIQDLSAQQNASVKDILRAFMVKLVMNLNKNLTTNLVNNLIQQYKIEDYLAYGDALATQVYAMKYIDQNFDGDARTQMMMRSLIQSEKVPEQARVAAGFANQQAREFVASTCSNAGQLDAKNATSLQCLASYGQMEASPMFRYMNALDTASQIKGRAQQTAQAEIAQSNGYAPPRDCSGSIALQSQMDSQILGATRERDAAASVLARMKLALQNGQTTAEEVGRAQTAYDAAEQNFANLPSTVSKPVVDICRAIDSPGAFVGSSIQKFLDQHIDQTSQLKSDNLPFYADFLSDVAGNFLTNLLTGGKSTSQVFKEAGLSALGAGMASVPQIITGAGNNNSGGPLTSTGMTGDDVQIYARTTSGSEQLTSLQAGQPYVLVIDFSRLMAQSGTNQDPAFNPTRALISGGSVGSLNFQLSPAELAARRIEIDISNITQTFTINVQFFASVQGGDTPLRNGGWSKTFIVSSVQGVSTVNFNPRGATTPPQAFRPR